MKTNLSIILKPFVFFGVLLTVVILLDSCIPQKKLKLVQTKERKDTTTLFSLNERPKNIILPFDNLYIKVISSNIEASQLFNSESNSNVQLNTDYNMISYTVNDSGYIQFPFIGLIKVSGLSLHQAADTIHSKLDTYISGSDVIVKFVGKNITILGEVNNQGRYNFFNNSISIFNAISLAGGLTEFGDRETVTIMREYGNKLQYHYIDLTDKNVVKSPYYYLRPDDVLIIQPLKHKSYGFSSFPYTIVLSGLTTVIALITFSRSFN